MNDSGHPQTILVDDNFLPLNPSEVSDSQQLCWLGVPDLSYPLQPLAWVPQATTVLDVLLVLLSDSLQLIFCMWCVCVKLFDRSLVLDHLEIEALSAQCTLIWMLKATSICVQQILFQFALVTSMLQLAYCMAFSSTCPYPHHRPYGSYAFQMNAHLTTSWGGLVESLWAVLFRLIQINVQSVHRVGQALRVCSKIPLLTIEHISSHHKISDWTMWVKSQNSSIVCNYIHAFKIASQLITPIVVDMCTCSIAVHSSLDT